MKHLLVFLFVIIWVFEVNGQSQPQKLQGQYEAIIKANRGSYLVKMELDAIEKQGANAFIIFEKFKNKKGKLPSTIYTGKGKFGFSSNKISKIYATFSMSENNAPAKIRKPAWNVQITKMKNGELYIKTNDGLTGNYKLIMRTGNISPAMKQQYLSGLEKHLDGQRLIVGEVNKIKVVKYEQKQRNGLLLETYVSDVENLFSKEELKVIYKFDNINDYPTIEQSPYQKMKSLLPKAIGRMTVYGKSNNTLDFLPNLKRLKLVNAENREDFIVTINRNDGYFKYDVQLTENGKLASKDWDRASNENLQAYNDRQLEIAEATIKDEMKGGKNPSNGVIKISYSNFMPRATGEQMDRTMKNIFYGKFDRVRKHQFYERFYNTFLTIASSYYGKNYRKDNISHEFRLGQTIKTTTGSGGTFSENNKIDFEIWMQPRFLDKFKESFNTDQFLQGNMIGWGDSIESIFKQHSADSMVFKQFLENVYRYSKGLEPVSTVKELNSL